jgi:shikimate kinase
LGVDFADSDALLEHRLGMPIAAFFAAEGEARFRDAETAILDELTRRPDLVIATGGGVVLRETNRRLLRERTVCIWLEARPEALLQRLGRSNRRPLFLVDDPKARLMELAAQREPLYRETALIVVAAGRSAGATCQAIVRALEGETAGSGPNAA